MNMPPDEAIFHEDVYKLFERFEEATDPEVRTRILHEMCFLMADEHDLTDDLITDEVHSYVEDYLKARSHFNREVLRLGRFMAQTIRVETSLTASEDPVVPFRKPLVVVKNDVEE